jgi:hypothetical protein
MNTDKPQANGSGEFSLLGFAAFLVIVSLFMFVSTKAGTRGVGVCVIVGALIQQISGRIEYGWEGRPPSGYITGWAAAVLNLVFGILGLAMVIWPDIAMGILSWDKK